MKAVKFTFDEKFDGGSAASKKKAAVELDERIARERQEAHDAGFEAGDQQAKASIEASVQETVTNIETTVNELFARRLEYQERMAAESARLGYTIASKLAPALMAAHPIEEIEDLVRDCLETCQKEPRLLVRINETQLDALEARMDHLRLASGFNGDVILLSDPAVGPGDCRVEWPDGGVERDTATVTAAIDDAVQRFVMSTTDDNTLIGSARPETELPPVDTYPQTDEFDDPVLAPAET